MENNLVIMIIERDGKTIIREVCRCNASVEESEHYIKSFPYNERRFMFTDEYFNTIYEEVI